MSGPDVIFDTPLDVIEFDTGGGVPSSGLVPKSLFVNKGDTLGGTATASTPAALAVGANDTVQAADDSTATGRAWKTLTALGAIVKSAFTVANQLVYSTATGVVAYLTVGSNTVVGNIGAGLAALTPAQVLALLGLSVTEIWDTEINTSTLAAPGNTFILKWPAPYDLTITGIKVYYETAGVSAGGSYQFSALGAGNALLASPPYNLESITPATLTSMGLTFSSSNLDLSAGDLVTFTIASNNVDLTGQAGGYAQLLYKAR